MKRRKKRGDHEETSYWSSYSDMMAALLLVFVLIISATMIQAKRQLEEQQGILEEQAEELAEQIETNEKQAEELERLTGLRVSLIEGLNNEFAGTDLSVQVDPKTGAITFDSSILFDVDKHKIKDDGKKFLQKFIPKYLKVLLSDEFKDHVAEIIIEGHTDPNGTYFHNLELSQDRALEVAKFCLDEKNKVVKKEEIKKLQKIITCNGRSFSDPIYKGNGKDVNYEASRRVEFKFRLKDEEMIDQMINILSDNGR